MKGYYHITEKIRDIAVADGYINVITEGDISEVDLNKQTIFPLLHIVPTNATIGVKTTTIDLTLMCLNVVDISNTDLRDELDPFFRQDNEQDVLNETLNFLNNIVSEFRRGDAYDDLFQVNGDPTAQPVRDSYTNLLAGWSMDFSVLVPNEVKIC